MKDYLIVLGAGPDQIPAFQAAKNLGIPTLAVDWNPDSPGFQWADQTLVASVKHPDELIPALCETNLSFRGVMTLGVEISPVVAAVGSKFGLTTVNEETAHLTTHKCARNRVLLEAGVPIPRFEVVHHACDIKMKPPFIIKPSDNSGSRGVQIVDASMDLEQVFAQTRPFSSDGLVLIEEQLKGPEISIEGFMLNGQMFVTGFADRNYSRNPQFYPYLVEDGGDYPTNLPEDVVRLAKQVFEDAARALGIDNGPSKGDLIVTHGGVKVLEITSRLSGGGFCSRIVPLQNGVNIVNSTVQWACGLEVDPKALLPRWNRGISHRFFFHRPGRITRIEGLEAACNMPGIEELVIMRPFAVGDVLEAQTYVNRLLYVVAVADERHQATEIATRAIQTISIDVVPD